MSQIMIAPQATMSDESEEDGDLNPYEAADEDFELEEGEEGDDDDMDAEDESVVSASSAFGSRSIRRSRSYRPRKDCKNPGSRPRKTAITLNYNFVEVPGAVKISAEICAEVEAELAKQQLGGGQWKEKQYKQFSEYAACDLACPFSRAGCKAKLRRVRYATPNGFLYTLKRSLAVSHCDHSINMQQVTWPTRNQCLPACTSAPPTAVAWMHANMKYAV